MKKGKSEWFFNSLYKKWELYLYRLFKLADYVESILRIHRLNAPLPEEFLKPSGFESPTIRIPPNPFLMEKDEDMFFWCYDDLVNLEFSDSDRGKVKLLKEIWERINEIKAWVGITKGTRFIGETREERRLINELNWYMDYPERASMIYKTILGDPIKEEIILIKFKNFLKDRSRIKGTKSLKYY